MKQHNRAVVGYDGMKGWRAYTGEPPGALVNGTFDEIYLHLMPKEKNETETKELFRKLLGSLAPRGKLVVLFVDARKCMGFYFSRRYTMKELQEKAFSGESSWDEEELYGALMKTGFIGLMTKNAENWPFVPDGEPVYGLIEGYKPDAKKA